MKLKDIKEMKFQYNKELKYNEGMKYYEMKR